MYFTHMYMMERESRMMSVRIEARIEQEEKKRLKKEHWEQLEKQRIKREKVKQNKITNKKDGDIMRNSKK